MPTATELTGGRASHGITEGRQPGSQLESPSHTSHGRAHNHNGVKRKGPQRSPGPSSAFNQVRHYSSIGQRREQRPRGFQFPGTAPHS